MHILLFIGYSLLCVYGIIKIPFIRNSGIRPAWLLIFFELHVMTGRLHNVIAFLYYPEHCDIWNFYQLSFLFRHRLTADFSLFLADNSTLTYITHNGIIWIQMILNIFSFDNLAINTLLFSFPVFLGNIALFRLFRRRFPNSPLAAISVFLLPSTLFWTSCIHREAVLYMLLGFLFYSFDQLLSRPAIRKHLIIIFSCLALILYFRFSILLSLLRALAAWRLAEGPWPRRRVLLLSGSAFLLLFLPALTLPGFFHPLAAAIPHRQQEFSSLEGHSRLALPVMDGTWTSIWKVLPYAIRNGLFEPLPGSGGQTIYLVFSFELSGIWVIVITVLVRQFIRSRQPAGARPVTPPGSSSAPSAPFILCCLSLALSGLLLIGAMIPFAGAIVRYRSFFLPFLMAPALCCLHSSPLIRSLDNWLSLHLFSLSGENPRSYSGEDPTHIKNPGISY